MTIRTHQSVSGFVASDPQLSHTERGDARLYLKLGIEHYRREEDNSYTQLDGVTRKFRTVGLVQAARVRAAACWASNSTGVW